MIVVTGVSGFIGWALTEELLRRGYKVLAVSARGNVRLRAYVKIVRVAG